MDKRDILLGKNKSKLSVNVDNNVEVNIDVNEKIIPSGALTHILNEYEQYITEKDASRKHRFIFTIKPYCTNVLFNAVSELVYMEGSDNCLFFGKQYNTDYNGKLPSGITEYHKYTNRKTADDKYLTRDAMIRDTAYSHKDIGPVVYHCGYDIFNNHTLRALEFNVINTLEGSNTGNDTGNATFNTILDYLRDKDGKRVTDKTFFRNAKGEITVTDIQKHLYQIDTISPYTKSINDNLIESNGWLGFINPTSMDINNYNDIALNKCMNNNKACEQIDMYPDRSLYSFLPKYNSYRDRYEPNWDVCLCYASGMYYDGEIVNSYGLECVYSGKGNNTKLAFKTKVKNTFDETSTVRLTFLNSGLTVIYQMDVELFGLSEEDPKEFYIKRDMVEGILSNKDVHEIRIAKITNNVPNKYYFQELTKIKDVKLSLNKLAFSNSIYGDNIVQYLNAVPLDVSKYTDNLGRQISELFICIIKRHKGDDKWYGESVYNGEDIEFNHCFGKVTGGLDLDVDSNNYNIHKIHNISVESDSYITESPKAFSSVGITIDDDNFIGNLVEFEPALLEETVIEPMYHRFNTKQRETKLTEYDNFNIDILYSDDYDVRPYTGSTQGSNFYVKQTPYIDNASKSPVNLQPEGYYYKPFYSVKLLEFDTTVEQGYDTKVVFWVKSKHSGLYVLGTAKNYGFRLSEQVTLYHKANGRKKTATIVNCSEGEITIKFDQPMFGEFNNKDYVMYKTPYDKPLYAYSIDDGSGRYFYREVLSSAHITQDSELYDSMFANGSHYHYTDINFYLKRQDPEGIYGMTNNSTPPRIAMLQVMGEHKDVSKYEYLEETKSVTC